MLKLQLLLLITVFSLTATLLQADENNLTQQALDPAFRSVKNTPPKDSKKPPPSQNAIKADPKTFLETSTNDNVKASHNEVTPK